MMIEDMKERAGNHPTIADRVEEWDVFDDWDTGRRFLDACSRLHPYHPKHNPDPSPFEPDRTAYEEELWFDIEYGRARALSEHWKQLRSEILCVNRFFPRLDADELLEEVVDLATRTVEPGAEFFRARISEDGTALPPEMMGAPPADSALGGRANPSGIPYLYLASSAVTAASEVRPHVGDSITIATVRIRRELRVVDLRNPSVGSPFKWGERLREVVESVSFLRELGATLSRPVTARSAATEYLPTQYLCEWMKARGYQGVFYESGVAAGFNCATFNPDDGEVISAELHRVEKVDVRLSVPRRGLRGARGA